MFILTEITTFCITVNFEPLVDHGFINHYMWLFWFGLCRLFRASGKLRIAVTVFTVTVPRSEL